MLSDMKTAKSKPSRNLGLYVPQELDAALRKFAAQDRRTLSAYVRIVLEKHVELRLRRSVA
jgi:predicted DNA-binding protein